MTTLHKTSSVRHDTLYDKGLHLFVDDDEVQDHPGFTRRVQHPTRLPEPVLRGDMPWERDAVEVWGSVIYDVGEGIFKAWYHSSNNDLYQRDGVGHFICYATSSDGVAWHKPELGVVPCCGSTANNIVFPTADIPHEFGMDPWGIFIDQIEPDPEKRYKMGFYQQRPPPGLQRGERLDVADQVSFFSRQADRHGMYTASSPDGIHWRQDDELRVPRAGDAGAIVPDQLAGGYLATSRRANTLTDHFMLQWKRYRRVIAMSSSRNFSTWSRLETILKPDDFDDGQDQMYTMTPFVYGNQYLGFLGLYRTTMEIGEVEMASARDPHHWQRSGRREIFLPTGSPGAWDSAWVSCAASPPIIWDDELYIFYSGSAQEHGTAGNFRSAIGLARLRRDGFVALRCGIRGGELMTEPITITGSRLALNASSPFGTVDVQVVDDTNIPPGFTFDDCNGLRNQDHTAFQVTWGEAQQDLTPFLGEKVRLHMRAGNATSLFSYRIFSGE